LESNGIPSPKSAEQWIDGPKLAKYRPLNGGSCSSASTTPTHKGSKKSETWIDGPAARVQHHHHHNQGNNFPSPKKCIKRPPLETPPPCSKAQMIQKWICNQSPSPFLEELSQDDEFFYASHFTTPNSRSNNHHSSMASSYMSSNSKITYHGPAYHRHHFENENSGENGKPEPEYKQLTVFKTCEDEDDTSNIDVEKEAEDIYYQTNNVYGLYDFEFIEVVEPDVPVPTKDACFQVYT